MRYADETSSDELEAIYEHRRDVDLEMAEMNAAADAWHAVRDHGYCNHGSATGHRNPPVHKVQKLLKPGQLICTAGCGTVFTDEVDYMTQCGDPMANPVPLPGHPAHTPAPATTPAPPEA